MTKRINGTPDRTVYETDTFGSGGSGGATTVDNFPVDYPDALAETRLAAIIVALSDLATELTLGRFVGPYDTPYIGTRQALGVHILDTPALGNQFLIRRIWVKSASINGLSATEFEVKSGSTVLAHDEIIGNQPYVDGVVKLGEVDGPLTIEVLSTQKVFYNISAREVTP